MGQLKSAPDQDTTPRELPKQTQGLPFYPQLPEDFLDPKLLSQLSHARCIQWVCLPICEDTAGVTIATYGKASIEDLNALLSQFFDKRIQWVICPEKYLRSAIHRAFGHFER